MDIEELQTLLFRADIVRDEGLAERPECGRDAPEATGSSGAHHRQGGGQ